MDKLKAMQVFVAIADAGSLTAAAIVQHSSLPAVVRHLAALETQLGARLFNRTTRRVVLTEEGRHYLERCRQILALMTEADAELKDKDAEPQGQLRMTAPVLFGQLHVCDAVARFVQSYPKVCVDVQLLDRVVNLVEEGFDLGIRIGRLESSTLVAQQVGVLRRVVVATPSYLASHGEPLHPKELLSHNCLRYTGGNVPWWTFHEHGKSFSLPVQGNLAFNQVAPLAQACLNHMGFGMFISYQVASSLRSGALKVVLADYESPPRPIHIVYPQSRLLPARTRTLIDWLKREMKAVRWSLDPPGATLPVME